MKTLSSVLLVLVAAATPAFADSAYFLKPAARSAQTATVAKNSGPVNSDRISVSYRPMTRASSMSVTNLPTVFVDQRYMRGSAQAAIVR